MWDFFKGSKWTTTSQSSPSFSSLFIIIIFKDVSISLSEEEKERQRSYIFCALLSKFPQQLGQDWAEASSLECHPGLSRGWQRIKGPLVGSWTGSTTAEMRLALGCGHPKWQPNFPHYNVPSPVFLLPLGKTWIHKPVRLFSMTHLFDGSEPTPLFYSQASLLTSSPPLFSTILCHSCCLLWGFTCWDHIYSFPALWYLA